MKKQDPSRNVDLIRNILRDELLRSYVQLLEAESAGDDGSWRSMLGAMAVTRRIGHRLQITTADEGKISAAAERLFHPDHS